MAAADVTTFNIASSIAQSGFSVLALVALFLTVLSLSSYVKIVTVLSIVRAGFGMESIPSGFVTGIISLVLSLFIMFPTIQSSTASFDSTIAGARGPVTDQLRAKATTAAFEEWKLFLSRHAHPQEKERFLKIARDLASKNPVGSKKSPTPAEESAESIRVLAPAFLVSELKEAFSTGLTLFLPLLVVDLVVSNVLVAVGLLQVSPFLVSLPFKLLLFVLVDGWGLIVGNLLLSYGR